MYMCIYTCLRQNRRFWYIKSFNEWVTLYKIVFIQSFSKIMRDFVKVWKSLTTILENKPHRQRSIYYRDRLGVELYPSGSIGKQLYG